MYGYARGNPMSFVDPLGLDVFQLYDPSGFLGMTGHSATIIGNPGAGYDYYSSAPIGHAYTKHVPDLRDFNKIPDPMKGNAPLMQRYTGVNQIYTSTNEDQFLNYYASQHYNNLFFPVGKNCANRSANILNSSGTASFGSGLLTTPANLFNQVANFLSNNPDYGRQLTPGEALQYHGIVPFPSSSFSLGAGY
jgi:hypothetical protein